MPQNNNIDDSLYPIEPLWALKDTLVSLIIFPIFIGFVLAGHIPNGDGGTTNSYDLIIYLLAFLGIPGHFLINLLRRATFHYQMNDDFLSLQQGILNKSHRQLHYGVIQNILIKQSIFDRLFGISTLIVQNASGTNTPLTVSDVKRTNTDFAGFLNNTISIPGLKKEHSEIIRDALLKKIKEKPIEELGM